MSVSQVPFTRRDLESRLAQEQAPLIKIWQQLAIERFLIEIAAVVEIDRGVHVLAELTRGLEAIRMHLREIIQDREHLGDARHHAPAVAIHVAAGVEGELTR
jgi:hypothetical protein